MSQADESGTGVYAFLYRDRDILKANMRNTSGELKLVMVYQLSTTRILHSAIVKHTSVPTNRYDAKYCIPNGLVVSQNK